MNQADINQSTAEEAALSSLREQILANAKHLFPEIVNDYRTEHGNDEDEPKAGDIFDVITIANHDGPVLQGLIVVGLGVKAISTYEATEHRRTKAVVSTHTEISRSAALRALLNSTEMLLEVYGRDLLRPFEGARYFIPGPGGVWQRGVWQGEVDHPVLLRNVQHARGLRDAAGAQE